MRRSGEPEGPARKKGITRTTGTTESFVRAVVAAVTAAVAAYAVACSDSGGDGDPFVEPPVIASEDGVLEAELTVELTDTEVGGTPVTIRAYDGDFMPPTLAVSPGDVIRLKLANRIDD